MRSIIVIIKNDNYSRLINTIVQCCTYYSCTFCFPGGPVCLFVVFPETVARKSLQTPDNNNAPGCRLRGPEVHHRVRLQRRNRRVTTRVAGKGPFSKGMIFRIILICWKIDVMQLGFNRESSILVLLN